MILARRLLKTIGLAALGLLLNGKSYSQPLSIEWRTDLPAIPAPSENSASLGVAGAYSGVLNDVQGRKILILAGGANFSKKSLLASIEDNEPPQKIYHRTLFALTPRVNDSYQWQRLPLHLPLGRAYGVSFNTDAGVLFMGGEEQAANGQVSSVDSVSLLSAATGTFALTELANAPVSFSKSSAVMHQGKIYIIGGRQNGQPSNGVYIYDIKLNQWSRGLDYPGGARTNSIATVLKDTLYLFSGAMVAAGHLTLQTNGYKLSLVEDNAQWQLMADVKVGGNPPIGLLGAAAINVDEERTLFVGGYNKNVFDKWLATIKQVAGTASERDAKLRFFSQSPAQFKWNQQALIFDASTQQWSSLGETPFKANCGAAIERLNNNIVLLSGEIMPGIRTPSVKMASIR